MTNPTQGAALAPCPFCGETPSFERTGTNRQSCIVACGNCGCRHESSDEGLDSGRSWNDRATIAAAPVGPVATLHDDGYWTWNNAEAGRALRDASTRAGWRMSVYAAPQALSWPGIAVATSWCKEFPALAADLINHLQHKLAAIDAAPARAAAVPEDEGYIPPPEVYEDIAAERQRQDAQWGGPSHDDQHDPVDWAGFIEYQAYWGREQDPRRRFIKIAALAVAAIESIDRKAGGQA